jgi:hypothetical protein
MNITSLAWSNTGDFSLFIDHSSSPSSSSSSSSVVAAPTAYIIYTAHIQGFPTTHQMSIEQLAPDYLSSLGSAANSGFVHFYVVVAVVVLICSCLPSCLFAFSTDSLVLLLSKLLLCFNATTCIMLCLANVVVIVAQEAL